MATADPAADAPGGPRWHFWRGLGALHSAWFAYLLLAVLQLRVVWGVWRYLDLSTGDTAAYCGLAWRWSSALALHFAWSPLYTAYYGTVLAVVPDVWLATLVHRLVIVFAVSLLALALFRRLLPPGIAWLAAAWWAVLPINFNTVYEVHLFAALPVLVSWVLLAGRQPWARGVALALLGLAAVLMRSELAVSFGLVGLLCLGWELRAARRARREGAPPRGRLLWAYGLPLAAVPLLCLGAYWRSVEKGSEVLHVFRAKHILNMAQVYCSGYRQRHPEWTRNPWVEYEELMQAHFGKPLLPLTEMILRNPAAVLEHFAWNYRLLPSGLELLLFNATAGSESPDYIPVQTSCAAVRKWSFLLLGVLALGGALAAWQWRWWWQNWLRERALGWLALAAFLPLACLIIATQRPRPSYLFPQSLLIMATAGLAAHIILSQVPFAWRLRAVMPVVMIACCFLVKPYYGPPRDGQPAFPCRTAVKRMLPFKPLIAREGARVLLGDWAGFIALYVGKWRCQAFDYRFLTGWRREVPLETFLAENKIDLVYLDENLLRTLEAEKSPAAHSFLAPCGPSGWELVGSGDTPGARWRLFRRL
jgi:hypothetical protein